MTIDFLFFDETFCRLRSGISSLTFHYFLSHTLHSHSLTPENIFPRLTPATYTMREELPPASPLWINTPCIYNEALSKAAGW